MPLTVSARRTAENATFLDFVGGMDWFGSHAGRRGGIGGEGVPTRGSQGLECRLGFAGDVPHEAEGIQTCCL